MTQLFGQMPNGGWSNQHLEFDLKKNPLNQTCQTQNTLLFPGQSTIWKETNSKIDLQMKQENQKFNNFTKQKISTSIRKKSLCFITEINKLLSKNKIKTEFISKNSSFLQKSYFNAQGQKRKIHYRSQRSTYCPMKNKTQQVEVYQSQNSKGNFQQQNNHVVQLKISDDQKRKPAQKNNKFHKNLKAKISIFSNQKKSPFFNDVNNEPTASGKSDDNLIITEQSISNSDQKYQKQIINLNQLKGLQKSRLGKLIDNLSRSEKSKQAKTEKLFIKSSRKLTLEEEERGKQFIKSNKKQNIKLQRTLKGALSNTILCYPKFRFTTKIDERNLSEVSLQRRNQFLSNQHRTIDDIHYGKLKQNLKTKIQNIYKESQCWTQPKITMISEGSNMAISRNDKELTKFDIKDRKIRRTNTAITRTGLQYNLGRSYRRSSNDQVKKIVCLTGINNFVNNSTISQRNENLLIQELNSCKSDRIIRKLRQKYLQTPLFSNSLTISPQTSQALTPKKLRTYRSSQKATVQSTRILNDNLTSKQMEIEKMKVKLFEMMIDCDQERIQNKNLTKGLNVFEDYCDDVDKGLKNISSQISLFLQKD